MAVYYDKKLYYKRHYHKRLYNITQTYGGTKKRRTFHNFAVKDGNKINYWHRKRKSEYVVFNKYADNNYYYGDKVVGYLNDNSYSGYFMISGGNQSFVPNKRHLRLECVLNGITYYSVNGSLIHNDLENRYLCESKDGLLIVPIVMSPYEWHSSTTSPKQKFKSYEPSNILVSKDLIKRSDGLAMIYKFNPNDKSITSVRLPYNYDDISAYDYPFFVKDVHVVIDNIDTVLSQLYFINEDGTTTLKNSPIESDNAHEYDLEYSTVMQMSYSLFEEYYGEGAVVNPDGTVTPGRNPSYSPYGHYTYTPFTTFPDMLEDARKRLHINGIKVITVNNGNNFVFQIQYDVIYDTGTHSYSELPTNNVLFTEYRVASIDITHLNILKQHMVANKNGNKVRNIDSLKPKEYQSSFFGRSLRTYDLLVNGGNRLYFKNEYTTEADYVVVDGSGNLITSKNGQVQGILKYTRYEGDLEYTDQIRCEGLHYYIRSQVTGNWIQMNFYDRPVYKDGVFNRWVVELEWVYTASATNRCHNKVWFVELENLIPNSNNEILGKFHIDFDNVTNSGGYYYNSQIRFSTAKSGLLPPEELDKIEDRIQDDIWYEIE